MKTIVQICAHRIQFDYFSKSRNAVPDENEVEHVTALINQGFREGELHMTQPLNNPDGDKTFDGWWKIYR